LLKRITAPLTTTVALLLLPALALSDESTTLQAIMQGLRDNLVEIADGLLMDDFELIERGATGIATHPRIPPEQVQLVARELGEEMPAFKQFDMRVHDLAVEIGAAARAGDKTMAIRGFQEMIDGCFGCHITYKDRVASVLRATESREDT
jgi:cytochrome c1